VDSGSSHCHDLALPMASTTTTSALGGAEDGGGGGGGDGDGDYGRLQKSLQAAVLRQNAAEIVAAIENGADVNAVPPDGYRFEGFAAAHQLAYASRSRYIHLVSLVRLLYEHDANIDLPSTVLGVSPVGVAATWGNDVAVEEFISLGADLNTNDHFGKPPVWDAAHNGHTTSVILLARGGATLDGLDRMCGLTPVGAATETNQAQTVRALAELGADLEKTKPGGETPLMSAVNYLHEETVDVLIEKGANLSVGREQGTTLVWAAAAQGEKGLEVAKKLILAGAPVRAADFQTSPVRL